MAMQPSEEQGNSNRAEPAAADVRVSIGSDSPQPRGASGSVRSDSSQSGGAPEISENVVDHRPLLQVAYKGDWESAKRLFDQDSALKTAKITNRSETLLHIAALSAQDQFLVELVKLLSSEALEMVDFDGRTALHNAVLSGRIRMVKALVRSNPKLTQLADNKGSVPLSIAALEASMHKEIAWFLAKSTTDDEPSHFFSSPNALNTLIHLTYAGNYDITLYLVGRYPQLLTMRSAGVGNSILYALAMQPTHFPSRTRLSFGEALIYKCIPVDLNHKPTDKTSVAGFLCNPNLTLQCLLRSLWNAAKVVVPMIKRIHEVKLTHVTAVELAKQVCSAISYKNTTEIIDLFQEQYVMLGAISEGIAELVKLYIQFFPELIWISPAGKSLTTHAVKYRQEGILRLFLNVSSTNELSLGPAPAVEESREMILEATANVKVEYRLNVDVDTYIAGAAFQMQREIQWFKAVESWILPSVRIDRSLKKTYWNKFVEKHKILLQNGEKWMKDTANSCMLVSTLVAIVLFAAAFTVPGGNDSNTGVPLLLQQDSLLVFAISDALGLFSSITAILLFLAILTSRFEAQDFLYSLPKKILMGLCFLFLSLGFMLVAFATTLTMVLDERLEWVLTPITLLASVPMVLFIVLQIPLLYQMFKSTYGPNIFHPQSIWE